MSHPHEDMIGNKQVIGTHAWILAIAVFSLAFLLMSVAQLQDIARKPEVFRDLHRDLAQQISDLQAEVKILQATTASFNRHQKTRNH